MTESENMLISIRARRQKSFINIYWRHLLPFFSEIEFVVIQHAVTLIPTFNLQPKPVGKNFLFEFSFVIFNPIFMNKICYSFSINLSILYVRTFWLMNLHVKKGEKQTNSRNLIFSLRNEKQKPPGYASYWISFPSFIIQIHKISFFRPRNLHKKDKESDRWYFCEVLSFPRSFNFGRTQRDNSSFFINEFYYLSIFCCWVINLISCSLNTLPASSASSLPPSTHPSNDILFICGIWLSNI